MAIFFAVVKPIKRSDGRSSVAAAAYRSGSKLNDKKYGVVHNYARKSGIVYSEVMLPGHAPGDYADRETLWNAVEEAERSKNARVAREVIVALPYELTPEERIKVTRQYVYESFVSQGMCADFSIHEPKVKREGQAENPHAHIMLTTRSLDSLGRWEDKKRKDYILDRNGKKQYDPVKKTYKFKTYSVTDWDRKEKVEQWREQWAKMVNREFQRKGIEERIDHRSNERQGLMLLPQVHLGVAAHQMELRGVQTELGNQNRDRMATNQLYIRDYKNLLERVEHLEQTGSGEESIAISSEPVVLFDANQKVAEATEALFDREAQEKDMLDIDTITEQYYALALQIHEAEYAQKQNRASFSQANARMVELKRRAGNIEKLGQVVEGLETAGQQKDLLQGKYDRAVRNLQRNFQVTFEQIPGKLDELQQEVERLEREREGLMAPHLLREKQMDLENRIRLQVREKPIEKSRLMWAETHQIRENDPPLNKGQEIILKRAESQLQQLISTPDQQQERKRGYSRGR